MPCISSRLALHLTDVWFTLATCSNWLSKTRPRTVYVADQRALLFSENTRTKRIASLLGAQLDRPRFCLSHSFWISSCLLVLPPASRPLTISTISFSLLWCCYLVFLSSHSFTAFTVFPFLAFTSTCQTDGPGQREMQHHHMERAVLRFGWVRVATVEVGLERDQGDKTVKMKITSSDCCPNPILVSKI